MYIHEEMLKLAAAKIIQQRTQRKNQEMEKDAFPWAILPWLATLWGVGSQIKENVSSANSPYEQLKKLLQLQQTQAMMGAMGVDMGNPLEGLAGGYYKNYLDTSRQNVRQQFQDEFPAAQASQSQTAPGPGPAATSAPPLRGTNFWNRIPQ